MCLFYGYDGHGSVRNLTDSSGQVTDTYAYDAFGSLIERTGATSNNYLYAGEQFDPDLGFYYNRARYLNADTGRFINSDPNEGGSNDPSTLHKYLYSKNDPVNRIDPSGNFSISETLSAAGINGILNTMATVVLKGALVGGVLGGTRAFLAGEDISSGVIRGAIFGGIAGFLTLWAVLTPILAVAGIGLGAYSFQHELREGNYALAAFDGAMTVLGVVGLLSSLGKISFTPPKTDGDEAMFSAEEISTMLETATPKTGPMVEVPAQNPTTGKGLVDVEIKFNPQANINLHYNMEFAGIEGAPGNGRVFVRWHTANPKFPENGPTTQINTPKRFYLLPDGTWKHIGVMTEEERASIHYK